MKESRTFNVELTEFAAQLIVWVMRSDAGEEQTLHYIDKHLPDDTDTAGLPREEYVSALHGRLQAVVCAIDEGLSNSRKEAA